MQPFVTSDLSLTSDLFWEVGWILALESLVGEVNDLNPVQGTHVVTAHHEQGLLGLAAWYQGLVGQQHQK